MLTLVIGIAIGVLFVKPAAEKIKKWKQQQYNEGYNKGYDDGFKQGTAKMLWSRSIPVYARSADIFGRALLSFFKFERSLLP